MDEIRYIDRETGKELTEKVPGFWMIKVLYSKRYMKPILKNLIANRFLSSFYGWYMKTKFSKRFIAQFVQEYDIDLNESIKRLNEFTSFNDFFIRKIKPEARQIDTDTDTLLSPADGKILVYEDINESKLFSIKGSIINISNLLQKKELSSKYDKCSIAIIRLAPTDYHRFHFPTDGFVKNTRQIDGLYYSVSPIALQHIPNIFSQNKRTITEIDHPVIGTYLYLEIGATMVGSIRQTYTQSSQINKADEKGYFQFGGSTVILLFPTNKVKFDADLISNTDKGIETKIKMGERIALISG